MFVFESFIKSRVKIESPFGILVRVRFFFSVFSNEFEENIKYSLMHADSDISSDVFGQSLRTFSIESLTATQEKWHQERTYVLLWIYQGSGRQYIDDQVYEIQEDQVWFVGPSQIHRWETKGIQGLKMTFSLDFMCATGISDQFIERLQLFGQHPPFAQVNAKAAARLKQLTDWWEEEENAPSTQQML